MESSDSVTHVASITDGGPPKISCSDLLVFQGGSSVVSVCDESDSRQRPLVVTFMAMMAILTFPDTPRWGRNIQCIPGWYWELDTIWQLFLYLVFIL